MVAAALDILTLAALLFGLFFLFIGALGVWRLPDVFNRMHAASKCTTLGLSGALIAVLLHFTRLWLSPDGATEPTWETLIGAATRAALVILFQFTAAPVGAHMLARAAHLDGAAKWPGTIDDELEHDRAAPPAPPAPPPPAPD
jgi:multicomponent Na+:H+ antiporter subunit G